MKSLQESLFDRDLIKRPAELDSKAVWDILFKEIYCKMKDDCVKKGWLMDMSDDTIFVYKTFSYAQGLSKIPIKVTLAIYQETYDHKLTVPLLRFMKQCDDWDISDSDKNMIMRLLSSKGFELEEGKFGEKYFHCDSHTIYDIVKLFNNMIKSLISPKYTKLIQDQIDKFGSRNKFVPGVVVDQSIIKPLIKEA